MFWPQKLDKNGEECWAGIRGGDRVDIVLSGAGQSTYSSTILSVDEAGVHIETPRLGASVLEVEIKSKAVLNVYSTEFGILKFASSVLGQEWEKERSIYFSKPARIERLQRRQFVRIKKVLKVSFGLLPQDASNALSPDSIKLDRSGVTRDISEGGLQLVSGEDVPSDSLVSLLIELDASGTVFAAGKVLSQESLGMGGRQLLRIQFVMIRNEDKDILRRYISQVIKQKKEEGDLV